MYELFKESFKVYSKHWGIVVFFSLTFLISLIIPLFSPAPTYSALGGWFLRSGSMPELTLVDVVVILISSLISLYLLSLALVAINLVVKAARTRTRVGSEATRNLGKYTIVVFCLFLAVKVIETSILYLTLQRGTSELFVYIFGFFASLGLFYAAPAVVLEERKPVQAFLSSYIHIIRKPLHFVVWLLTAFVFLSIITLITYSLFDVLFTRQIIIALVNSLVILPFLIILQAQIYLTKYGLIK